MNDPILKLLRNGERGRDLEAPAEDAAEAPADRSSGSEADAPPTDAVGLLVEFAHDFRSPLTSILFLADTLRRGQSGEVNEIQAQQLKLIYSAALALLSVSNDVMELAGNGEAALEGEPSPLSIAKLFHSVRDIVQPMAEIKDLEVRLSLPASDQRIGYELALNRVLLNLTTNALNYTREGYVEIAARMPGLNRFEFSVRDTGPGIGSEVLPNLYDPFRHAGPAENRFASAPRSGVSNSGLGLHICRRLVAGMGGELQFETRPNWGTRFYFEVELPPAASI